ncbi:putative tRNA(Ile)-lysidine synthetase, partial [Tanacetum coccineum]
AELFILRLSRNSGVLGLAGMALTTQLFATHSNLDGTSNRILLVRPLLDFTKQDLYKIRKGSKQEWVEDPTNQKTIFARNRIRRSLGDLSSSIFKSELQAIIFACRQTRFFVDQICQTLINQSVTVMPQGYAIVDLNILSPSEIPDICLSKFVTLLGQFISQRQRPVCGSAQKLLLDYFRSFPCRASFTAAGCYLCPSPGSKGTKLLVCCSVNSALPMKMESFCVSSSNGHKVSGVVEVHRWKRWFDNSEKCFLEKNSLCSDYVRVLAKKGLLSLKFIPVAARRSLPVLVNPEGQVISIPSVSFSNCRSLNSTQEYLLVVVTVHFYDPLLKDASKTGVAQETLQNAVRRGSKAMTELEARQILGVTGKSSWEEIAQ